MEVFKIPAVFAFYEASVLAACAKVGHNNVVAFFASDSDDCLRKAPCFAVSTVLQKGGLRSNSVDYLGFGLACCGVGALSERVALVKSIAIAVIAKFVVAVIAVCGVVVVVLVVVVVIVVIVVAASGAVVVYNVKAISVARWVFVCIAYICIICFVLIIRGVVLMIVVFVKRIIFAVTAIFIVFVICVCIAIARTPRIASRSIRTTLALCWARRVNTIAFVFFLAKLFNNRLRYDLRKYV